MENAWADQILRTLEGRRDFVDVKPALKELSLRDDEVRELVGSMHRSGWVEVHPHNAWEHLAFDRTFDEIALTMRLKGPGIARIKALHKGEIASALTQAQLDAIPKSIHNARWAIRISIGAAAFTLGTLIISGIREYREQRSASATNREAGTPTDKDLSHPDEIGSAAKHDSLPKP